jgi:hypothetical protein
VKSVPSIVDPDILRSERAVKTRRQERNIFHRVVDPALLEFLEPLYRIYCRNGQ